jgi:UDP-glucuronate 4-epimerase
MNILVTGSAGFIGMHLCRRLLAEGHKVHGLDNFNAYYPVALKRARQAELADLPRFSSTEADISDLAAVTDVFRRFRPEVVCNLAAQPGVRYSIDHPHVYAASNLAGFLNILEGCRHHGVRRLVYASSSSVYGGNTKLPFAESDPVDHPVSLYAATKRANELMAHTYTHLYGLQTIGLRFFTVYGPWGRPDMAVWLFTRAMLAGRPIQVFNRGDMQRDFTYIDDIVAGVTASIVHDGLDPCELFNIGNHKPERLMDLIRTLADALGVEPTIDLLPMQPGDVPATYADISRIRAKLGFEPTTPIARGIPAFAAWYRAHPHLIQPL